MSNNMEIWDNLKTPPPEALKTIQAGRLKGKSDINPQWRYEAMTKQFGVCGIGWKYTIKRTWTEPGKPTDPTKEATAFEVFAFAEIELFIKDISEKPHIWSNPIPATGGSMLVVLEKNGLHSNDEAYKMAITDALGTAMKMIGVAADVYKGTNNDSKYGKEGNGSPVASSVGSGIGSGQVGKNYPPPSPEQKKLLSDSVERITEKQNKFLQINLKKVAGEAPLDKDQYRKVCLKYISSVINKEISTSTELTKNEASKVIDQLVKSPDSFKGYVNNWLDKQHEQNQMKN